MTINTSLSRESYSRYLRLFQMQVMGVLEDMEKPAESLSTVFSDALMNIMDLKQNLADVNPQNEELNQALSVIIKQMQDCIVGFQFFDAKRQRLENISDGLGDFSEFVASVNDASKPIISEDLESRVVGQYKMEREHEIYRKFLEEYESLIKSSSAKL